MSAYGAFQKYRLPPVKSAFDLNSDLGDEPTLALFVNKTRLPERGIAIRP
jgi:hypothetical protein